MKIDGHTRTCGLIGNPVEHTLSPVIHNTLAEIMGHNMVYVPLRVEETLVEQAVNGANALNLLGCNVTVPHKSAVIPYLADIDELAKNIGAVNTLVRVPGGFKGYNTDMTGLKRALLSEGIDLSQEEAVVILGAGGASRAVAFLCASLGVKTTYLLNRSVDKAEAVACEVNSATRQGAIIPMSIADYKKIPVDSFVCLQGTSVGLYPNVKDVVIDDDDFYKKVKVGFDLIYKPAKTEFMNRVEANGGKAVNGLKMLMYQGFDAYELWNECKITKEAEEAVYKKLVEATRV